MKLEGMGGKGRGWLSKQLKDEGKTTVAVTTTTTTTTESVNQDTTKPI